MWKADNDPSRCDWARRHRRQQTDSPRPPPPAESSIDQHDTPEIVTASDATITLTPIVTARHDLARRVPACMGTEDATRSSYTIQKRRNERLGARNMSAVQDTWDRYLREVKQLCSEPFWKFFLRIHAFPGHVIDTTLKGVKQTFLQRQSAAYKQFPTSRRALLDKINKVSTSFWPHVLHTTHIDLSRAGLTKPLASGTTSISFEFLDPVWAWLVAARRLDPLDLHWKPIAQNVHRPVYGGGVQYGECFAQACKSCPPDSYPMCISLHWDGTSGGGIQSTPICIGVGNTNNCSADTQCCIGACV